jgi:hypothetical protein
MVMLSNKLLYEGGPVTTDKCNDEYWDCHV